MRSLLLFTFLLVLAVTQTVPLSNLPGLIRGELSKHNLYRARHGCPPLALNATLIAIAQNYSEHLATQAHKLVHSPAANHGKYG